MTTEIPFLREQLAAAGLTDEQTSAVSDIFAKVESKRVGALTAVIQERNAQLAAARAVRSQAFAAAWEPIACAYLLKYGLGGALGLATPEELRADPSDVVYPDLDIDYSKL